jgi:16S rRNA A1518/A1519 N6-dimethyltransferase RsmA/KsgA/DIM1 with predicted DNA glycosylase/AP lyase activity
VEEEKADDKKFIQKSLGQHFLKDKTIARKIAESLTGGLQQCVLEIGRAWGYLLISSSGAIC